MVANVYNPSDTGGISRRTDVYAGLGKKPHQTLSENITKA
jgi:hypothetical protein